MLELKTFINITIREWSMKCACSKALTLQLRMESFFSVVGSNGSGKTSMLNNICGSIPVESGNILLTAGILQMQKSLKETKKIGRVYQNPCSWNLPVHDHSGKHVPGRTIKENASDLEEA